MAAPDRTTLETGTRATSHVPITDQHQVDLLLQRGAMRTMLAAMLVMALGVPLHLGSLGTQPTHLHTDWSMIIAWLCALLTLSVFWVARPVLRATCSAIRRRRFSHADLVVICACGAFAAGFPALLSHAAPMYFDVAAMAIAWIVAGQAQEAGIRRRFAVMVAQLAPLNWQLPVLQPTASDRLEQPVAWLGSVLLGSAVAALMLHLWWGHDLTGSSMVSLALLAAACPCALGIAGPSACAAGVERAMAAGWLVPSGAALGQLADVPQDAARLVMPLGAADLPALAAIARSVQCAIRRNYLWAAGLNLALVPLALLEPIPPLVPAAVMLAARWLIGISNARI
jgi:cation transport ATPase